MAKQKTGPKFELRASASSRWMSCTASATIDVSHLAVRPGGPAAELGTALHEVSETCLRDDTNPFQYVGQIFNSYEIRKEHVNDIVKPYVDFVRSESKGHVLRVECKFDLNAEMGGTADAVVIGEDFIHVIDLKTGRYWVDAVDNSQLLIYALGAYLKYGMLSDIERVGVTIFQPMVNNVSTHWINVKALMAFSKTLFGIHKRIMALDVSFVASTDNCRYCPAVTVCPILHEKAVEQARIDFTSTTLNGQELVDKLALGELLIPWFESLKMEAKARLAKGINVPGYELRKGRASFSWIDPAKAVRALRRADIDGIMTESTLRSPAQVRELIKLQKADFELNDLLVLGNAEASLAKSSKTQPKNADKSESAKMDFKGVGTTNKRGKK